MYPTDSATTTNTTVATTTTVTTETSLAVKPVKHQTPVAAAMIAHDDGSAFIRRSIIYSVCNLCH